MTTEHLPFDTVETKFSPVVTGRHTVIRSELLERLSIVEAPNVSVIAPAGYGKTTLLALWAQRDPRPFAPILLGGGDNDPAVLLQHVVEALDEVGAVDPELFEVLSTRSSVWSSVISRVCAAYATFEMPVVLVFDDLHLVHNRDCLDVVGALQTAVPQGSQLVVSTREDPRLPLARLRAQGRLVEVGVEDLRLHEGEAAQLLEGAGLTLDGDVVARLVERTEGWPAGLYLAALSMKTGRSDPTRFPDFRGDHRFVGDYLRLEVLERTSEDEVRFLTHTSVLDSMCGPLCDAVLDRSGSTQMLEALARTNRFLVPLDDHRKWYRYHHLFRDLLRDELDRAEPDRARELSRRAMEWCLANDAPEVAVRYGHEAGDHEAVAQLIGLLAMSVYWSGRIATVEEWLDWYRDDLERQPVLAVYGWFVSAFTGDAEQAERWAGAAERLTFDGGELPDGSTSIEPWKAIPRLFMCANGVTSMLSDADMALAELHPESAWRPTVLAARGAALAFLGRAEEGDACFRDAVDSSLACGDVDVLFFALAERALLAIAHGHWESAAELTGTARDRLNDAGLDNYVTAVLVDVAEARLAMYDTDHARARDCAARVHRFRPLLTRAIAWISVQVRLELVRVHLGLREPTAAKTVLREVDEIMRRRPGMGTLMTLAEELHDQAAGQSDPDGRWAISLTAAELHMLPFLATHLNFPDIAARLTISRNTVKSHANSIYRKLGVSSRVEAVDRAIALGLFEAPHYVAQSNPHPRGVMRNATRSASLPRERDVRIQRPASSDGPPR